MRYKGCQKGSLTLFSILLVILVVGCLLSLLEGARFLEMQRIARNRTLVAVESAFANYNKCLWDTYRILGCNREEMEACLLLSGNGGYSESEYGINLFLMRTDEVAVERYTLLTDGNGAVYIEAVSNYMRNNMVYETAKAIYNQYDSVKALLNSNQSDGTEIDKALESLEELEKEKTQKKRTSAVSKGTSESKGNLLTQIKSLQEKGVLELVIQDSNHISNKEYELSEAVSQRSLQVGNKNVQEEIDWIDRILLQQYFLTYLADYTNPKENRAVAYELEYLIAGKDSDLENLKYVVGEILMIREAANFAYLLTDNEKVQQAQLLAIGLAGATVNAAAIEAVKYGILLAWSFAESVLDVRALLAGKTVPLIKNRELWTLSLDNIEDFSEDYMMAKESKYGISYQSYLGILILFQKDHQLAYRSMDVQELTIQQEAYPSLGMDDIVVQAQVNITYCYRPAFTSMETIVMGEKWDYKINTQARYEYN